MPCSVSDEEEKYYDDLDREEHPNIYALKDAYKRLADHHIEIETETEKLRDLVDFLFGIIASSDKSELLKNISKPKVSKPLICD